MGDTTSYTKVSPCGRRGVYRGARMGDEGLLLKLRRSSQLVDELVQSLFGFVEHLIDVRGLLVLAGEHLEQVVPGDLLDVSDGVFARTLLFGIVLEQLFQPRFEVDDKPFGLVFELHLGASVNFGV